MPNVPGEPGGTAMDIPADPGGLAVARFGHAPEDPGTDVETGAASPHAAPVVS
jgi:hypothetical protein